MAYSSTPAPSPRDCATTADIVGTPLRTERLPDGKRKVLEDLIVCVRGEHFIVKAGAVTDYSSFPWWASWVVHWSKVDIAGVVHDQLYVTALRSKWEADRLWFRIAISGKHRANRFQASLGWLGLMLGGWYVWNRYRRNEPERAKLIVIEFRDCHGEECPADGDCDAVVVSIDV